MPDETPEQIAEREAAEAKAKADNDKLGEGGKAALDAERSARKRAEKEARDAKKRADDLEAERLSDTERLEARAKRGDEMAATATSKLRKANLRLALAGKGLVGPKAKAAERLLDQVEYDEDDEPTNLDTRITAAKAEFSDAFPKAATANGSKPDDDASKGDDKGKDDTDTDTHAGARRDAAASEEEAQMLDAYLRQSFPGLTNSEGTREGAPA